MIDGGGEFGGANCTREVSDFGDSVHDVQKSEEDVVVIVKRRCMYI